MSDLAPAPSFRAVASQAPPIAELMSVQNSVRVQDEGELIWDEASGRRTLFRRQSLLTLEGARAEIAFLDGTGLVIDEKSLVVLEKSPADDSGQYQRIVLRLVRGTLHKASPRKTSDLLRRIGSRTPEFEIEAGGARIELTPTSEVTVTTSHVLVQGGEIKITGSSGSPITVRSGEEARLAGAESKTPPVVQRAPFLLLSPKAGQSIEAQTDRQAVRFRWNATRDAVASRPQELEASRDPDFRTGVLRARIAGAEPPLEYVEINLEVPASRESVRWHWRVRSGERVSVSESFSLAPRVAPASRYPTAGARVAAGSALELSWGPILSATSYEIEVSGRPPLTSTEPFVRVDSLEEGTARWRVRARLSDGSVTEWGESREIRVGSSATDETPPPPPDELEEPELRRVPETGAKEPAPRHTSWWRRLWISEARAEELPTDQWFVLLKWKSVPGIKRYRIQVSRDRSFKQLISESESESAQWEWRFKPGMENSKGRAFFRVASISGKGTVGAYSKPKPIPVTQAINAKKEVYAAKETGREHEAVGVADAAEHGDLHDLAKKSALSADATGPRVGPPRESVVAPVAATPAVVAHSVETFTITPAVTAPAPGASLALEALLYTGYGSVSQSSGASDLSSIAMRAPYFQQRIAVAGQLRGSPNRPGGAGEWRAAIQGAISEFEASKDSPNAAQASIRGVSFRLDVAHTPAGLAAPWAVYLGGTIDRSYRWVKATGTTVDTQGGIAVGPYARATRVFSDTGPALSLRESGFSLALPLSGFATGSQTGVDAQLWADWNLFSVLERSPLRVAVRAEAETTYMRWGSPDGTGVFAWTFWIAPAARF